MKFLFSSKAAKIPDNPSKHYLFKVNNKNTRRRCVKTCSKLIITTPERRQSRHRSGVFSVKFEYILRLLLLFLLLTLSMYLFAGTEQLSQLC